MDAATLEPVAGAQGELTGLLMIRACLEARGNPRKKVLIPDSAHGTNPASVVIAGYEVQNIKSNARGQLDTDHLREFVTEDVAALMLTNPTHARRLRGTHRRNCRHPARTRRAALHGRREYERASRHHAPRRFRRRRDALESAQDIFNAAWRRRPRRRSGGGEEDSRALSARAGRGRKGTRKIRARFSIGRNPSAAFAPIAEISEFCCARWPTRWPTARESAKPPKTP